MRHRMVLGALGVLALVLATNVRAEQPARSFPGYWMGIDPLDGGDSRRSILQLPSGSFGLIGRDTVLTLCDNTDRGIATFEDGVQTARNQMASDNLNLHCFNSNAAVILRARYTLLDANTMIEDLTRPDGMPVTKIVFHRVSE